MFIDNKGKLFGKINVIDLLVILIVIAAIAGLAPKFIKSGTSNPIFSKAETITVGILIEEGPDFSINDIKKGDFVKDPVRNSSIGKVVDIKTAPSIYYQPNDKGEYVKTTKQGYLSATITVEATGLYSDRTAQGGVTIDNVDQYLGRLQEFRVGNSALFGRISSLVKKG
jgi:hypothetical protein